MGQTHFILRSLSKISKKRWEHYAINRIYHRLSDPEIEFVCQQCIRKDDGQIYLADFFLPQLDIYLEIDEGHHDSEEAKIRDAKRSFDIAEAAGLTEVRIAASGVEIEQFNSEIDAFVELVRQRKDAAVKNRSFRKWEYEHRFTARPHLETGSVEIGPHAAFRTHKDALECFGYNKGHMQRGTWNLPPHVADALGLSGNCMVWFPKLYEQPQWNNSLSDDGTIISEVNKNPDNDYDDPWDKRIVMARSRDELNRTLYRFVGVFENAPEYRSKNERKFRRVATSLKTYPSSSTN